MPIFSSSGSTTLFNHKWKSLITKGNAALKKRSNSDARDLYSQAIIESDRMLKLFRVTVCERAEARDNCLEMVSIMVVSHHNMADLWGRYGVIASQTYYLEMVHQKLIDTVRDARFCQTLRSVALSELSRTYVALLSHYKTNALVNEVEVLVTEYSRVTEMFGLLKESSAVSAEMLIH